jgi:RNA polymerase sigma factor (sigma-70 family)
MPTAPFPQGVPAPGVDACGDVLASGLEQARREWGLEGFPLERFAARVAPVVVRRLARSGVDPTPDAVRATLERSALGDLAVALACDDEVPGAWESLSAALAPRFTGLARRRGAAPEEAAVVAQDVLSEMSLPATRKGPRRLIATYEGAGSLFGWGAVILSRRLSRSRRRDEARGEGGADRAEAREAVDRSEADPLDAAERHETERRLEAALASAWSALPGRDRLALAWRYVDGLPQTRIATLLRVSEPHTSRVLSAAVDRLREAARTALGEDSPTTTWPALAEALRRVLVSPGAPAPHPLEDSGPGASP